jgi:trafficking protein particle complex subunit 8
MTAITLLLLQTPLPQAKRAEILDPLLDSAIYSYTARSSSPYFSLRTVLISIELLTSKGGTAPDDAVKWATKALSSATLGDIGSCLLIERIAACYKVMHPRRRRKMALWSVLACENWMGVGCKVFAMRCLRDAVSIYKDSEFGRIGGHLSGLMESLGWKRGGEKGLEVVDMQHEGDQEGITVEFA